METRISAEAERDLGRIARWYREQRPGLEDIFLQSARDAVARIGASPEGWPKWRNGIRRVRLRVFPFWMFYEARGGVAMVLAVRHTRRDPASHPMGPGQRND